jgi:hypothetical protein
VGRARAGGSRGGGADHRSRPHLPLGEAGVRPHRVPRQIEENRPPPVAEMGDGQDGGERVCDGIDGGVGMSWESGERTAGAVLRGGRVGWLCGVWVLLDGVKSVCLDERWKYIKGLIQWLDVGV